MSKYQTTEVRAIDHIGITVPDLDAAAAFLEAALGAVPLYDNTTRQDPPFGGQDAIDVLGVKAGTQMLAQRMLRIGDGPGIELFQMSAPDGTQGSAATPSDLGLGHFAVYTDDIDATAKRFADAGGTLLRGPNEMLGIEKGPGNQFMYARTPWGTIVELITYPSPESYEATTDKRRWKPEDTRATD